MFSSAPAPGTLLAGKYLVERVLGEGGMGVVVAAKHIQLDQRVALKFVLPAAMASGDALERFAREARAAARLKSEHVARVLDVGTLEGGAPYMVMEYLEGRDLGAIIEERPLDPRAAVELVLQACEAVAEAHAAGIIHRDLKPKNLFITTRVDGRPLVKVLDFGISKQSNPDGSPSGLSLTSTAMVMGSPNYMSPEALRSAKQIDARSDLWALGVILYEAMTGRVPFVATTITQLTAMVLEQPPRHLSELRVTVPEGLAKAVHACLEKDPAKRTATVVELARALEPFGGGAGVADRIAVVARGGTTQRSATERPSERASAVSGAGNSSIAWGRTMLSRGSGARGIVVAALASVLTVVAVVALFVAVRRHSSSSALVTATALEPTPAARSAAPAPSALPFPTPPSEPSAAALAPSASAAVIPPPLAKLPPSHAHGSAPHAPPRDSTDDLPTERK